MKKIYKYPIQIADKQSIEYTPNAGTFDVMHIGLDPNGTPCIWACVDTKDKTKIANIFIFGTGHEIPDYAEFHLGTFNMGQFVWHVFSNE